MGEYGDSRLFLCFSFLSARRWATFLIDRFSSAGLNGLAEIQVAQTLFAIKGPSLI